MRWSIHCCYAFDCHLSGRECCGVFLLRCSLAFLLLLLQFNCFWKPCWIESVSELGLSFFRLCLAYRNFGYYLQRSARRAACE